MLNKPDLILFLQELWSRLNVKSPKFFRTVGWISMIMSAIGFIPDALKWLDITLPEHWMMVIGKLMIGAGIWGKITSSLVVGTPSPRLMPFTEKKQIEEAIAQPTKKNRR